MDNKKNINEDTFWEIVNKGLTDAAKSNGTLRKGQAVWNHFMDVVNSQFPEKTELFKKLVGTEKDPFYTDNNLPSFYESAEKIMVDNTL